MIILNTNFTVNSAVTVTNGYRWDYGVPSITRFIYPDSNGVITGMSPYTEVTFDINTSVLANTYKLTKFKFNFDDYYNESITEKEFTPRPPAHPSEDKYNAYWQWNKLTDDPKTFRKTLVSTEVLSGGIGYTLLSSGIPYNLASTNLSSAYQNIFKVSTYNSVYFLRNAASYRPGLLTNITSLDTALSPSSIFNIGPYATTPYLDNLTNQFKIDYPYYADYTGYTYYEIAAKTSNWRYPNPNSYINHAKFDDPSYWNPTNVDVIDNITETVPTLGPGLTGMQAYLIRETPYNYLNIEHYIEATANQATNNINYTIHAGIFVKAAGTTKIRLSVLDSSDPTLNFVDIDLASGELYNKPRTALKFAQVKLPNDWWYVYINANQNNASNPPKFRITLLDGAGRNKYIANETPGRGIYVYGANLLFNSFVVSDNTPPYNLQGYSHTVMGYFVPPETGYYYFSVACTGLACVYLCDVAQEVDFENTSIRNTTKYKILDYSTIPYGNRTPYYFTGKSSKLYSDFKDNPKKWDYDPNQQSYPQFLRAGTPYLITAVFALFSDYAYFDLGWSLFDPTSDKKKWYQTTPLNDYAKLWAREGYPATGQISHPYIMNGSYTPSLKVTLDASLTADYIYDDTDAKYTAVYMKDLPPQAGFICLSSTFGYSPLDVLLSPKSTVTGAFAIDQIDWDFGDGSPVVRVNRHTTTPQSSGVTYTLNYPTDPADPRNYNIQHTYTRNTPLEPQVYYPSLTAYSANTSTYSTCSREIGPVGTKSSTNKELIKTSFYDADNKGYYIFNVEGKTALIRRDPNYTRLSIPTVPTTATRVPDNLLIVNDFGTVYTGTTSIGLETLILSATVVNSTPVVDVNTVTNIPAVINSIPATEESFDPYIPNGLAVYVFNGYFNEVISFFRNTNYTVDSPLIYDSIVDTTIPVTTSYMIVGYFLAYVSGNYTFSLGSDDASAMWFGETARTLQTDYSNAFISNLGLHGTVFVSNTIRLEAGTHYPIRILVGNNYGGGNIYLSVNEEGSAGPTQDTAKYNYTKVGMDPYNLS